MGEISFDIADEGMKILEGSAYQDKWRLVLVFRPAECEVIHLPGVHHHGLGLFTKDLDCEFRKILDHAFSSKVLPVFNAAHGREIAIFLPDLGRCEIAYLDSVSVGNVEFLGVYVQEFIEVS
jgi:hypothetical protein